MLTLAGPGSTVYFTNLSSNSSQSLQDTLEPTSNRPSSIDSGRASVEATTLSILGLMKQRDIPIERVCLLDPKATRELSPEDGQGTFNWFLFGVRFE